MLHKEITAAVVAEAHMLLARGIDRATIAARLGLTDYVTGLIARTKRRNGHVAWCRPTPRRVLNAKRALDYTTVRMIQRMLSVGILKHAEIAREAGVSPNTVTDVATGKRAAISLGRPVLSRGERFLPEPIRCSVCRARISIVPCRACRARRGKMLASA